MGKVDFRGLPREEQQALVMLVTKTIQRMRKHRSFTMLLSDIITESEMIMMGRRIRIAQWLLVGKGCEETAEKLHAGLPTVYRVDRWLRQRCETYEKIFPSLYAEMVEAVQRERGMYAQPYSWRWIQNKYPMHCGLIGLLLDDIEARKRLRG